MIKPTPEMLADIYFYKPEEGGRKCRFPDNFYSCPIRIRNELLDARVYFAENQIIYPGNKVNNIPIVFLSPEYVFKLLQVGEKFYLWEGGHVGEGVVTKIFYDFKKD